ncbi:hypothetical protein [Pseudalkalibacillus decolorationis]|uniref:hypothetical protein n=1 Tax=Pseudalkalibacillus decolorationis TaxID=163879 RepID=UPI002147D18D|nr:hypothetical protein [Pseudalkalibacillus decolorationis]
MGSIYSAVKCPQCGRSAIEDFYYKSDESYIICYRCGFNYSKTISKSDRRRIEYKEEKQVGHGVFSLVKRNGQRNMTLFNSPIRKDDIEKFTKSFMENDVDQAVSYLVSYEKEIFTILLGKPPENFSLCFEDYKDKMIKKYGEDYEDIEIIVPIEE